MSTQSFFATAVTILDERSGPALLDAMCAGARPVAPRVQIDWSKSKEQNFADAIARINEAFAPKSGLYDMEDGEPSVASYSIEAA